MSVDVGNHMSSGSMHGLGMVENSILSLKLYPLYCLMCAILLVIFKRRQNAEI